MIKRLCGERRGKSGVVDAAIGRYEQQTHILFNVQEERRVLDMDETQLMSATTSLALHINKCGHVVHFDKGLGQAGVATEFGDPGILDELGQLHVAGSAERSSMDELHAPLQIEHHGIVYITMDEVDKLGVTPERCGEGVVVKAEHYNLAR